MAVSGRARGVTLLLRTVATIALLRGRPAPALLVWLLCAAACLLLCAAACLLLPAVALLLRGAAVALLLRGPAIALLLRGPAIALLL